MEDWLVNLIIGLTSVAFGFVSGFFTKSYSIKIKQKAKGNHNHQQIGEVKNGK